MRTQFSKLIFAAAFGFAMALTFSCSGGGDDNPLPPTAPKCGEYNTATQLCDFRDGKLYKFVTIKTQKWMAENLNYEADGSRCYKNEEANCTTYGRLYDWATAMGNSASSITNPSGVQGVCPSGWHLPSDAEWTVLTTAVGTDSGIKLKADSPLWESNSSSIKGTDDFGFSALPGGYGYADADGTTEDVGYSSGWWSSTESDASLAYRRDMQYNLTDVDRLSANKTWRLYYVRCVKD